MCYISLYLFHRLGLRWRIIGLSTIGPLVIPIHFSQKYISTKKFFLSPSTNFLKQKQERRRVRSIGVTSMSIFILFFLSILYLVNMSACWLFHLVHMFPQLRSYSLNIHVVWLHMSENYTRGPRAILFIVYM